MYDDHFATVAYGYLGAPMLKSCKQILTAVDLEANTLGYTLVD